jgi:transposase
MTKQKRPYTTYTLEFKQEAVRLMETTDRPASQIAVELGIRRNQLYKWKEQLARKSDKAFVGGGRPKTEDQSELTSLRQENVRLKEDVEILKKAAAYFAKELK